MGLLAEKSENTRGKEIEVTKGNEPVFKPVEFKISNMNFTIGIDEWGHPTLSYNQPKTSFMPEIVGDFRLSLSEEKKIAGVKSASTRKTSKGYTIEIKYGDNSKSSYELKVLSNGNAIEVKYPDRSRSLDIHGSLDANLKEFIKSTPLAGKIKFGLSEKGELVVSDAKKTETIDSFGTGVLYATYDSEGLSISNNNRPMGYHESIGVTPEGVIRKSEVFGF